VRDHERLNAAVVRRREQFERAAAVGLEAVAQMAKRATEESVSVSMPKYTQTRVRMRRPAKQDERARGSAVVPLALEKRLFLNASCRCLLVPLLGKKYCDINKRLTSF